MKLFTAILIFFLMASCKHAKHIITEPALSKSYGSELQGKWQLENLWGMDSSKLKPAFITFDFDSSRFTGNTGCNSIAGRFTLRNELLIIDRNIISTKMACPGYNDQHFITLLLKINKFTMDDRTLELSQDNLVLMTFKKE